VVLERFAVPGLAHYSYLLGSKGQAVVIDPKRDVDSYLDYASAKALKITHVLETHIHADYASGATKLAAATGAELWLSRHDDGEHYQYRFPHREVSDGDELHFGELRIAAIHTPGHTPEHLSFLSYEKTRCGQPMALFSGDFLFVGSLGRPDLLGEQEKQRLAHALYESVHRRINGLPDGVEVYPAHGAGSLCGSGIAQREHSTLGYERFCNVFMGDRSERDFVEAVLKSVPEFPDYYRRMKQLNSEGPKLLDGLPGRTAFPAAEFRAKMQELAAVVLDLRRPEAFGGAHIPGAFNIGAGPNLSVWAAWVLPYDRPILLVGDERADLDEARRSLIRVGLDDIAGYLRGGIGTWIEAGYEQAHIPQISVQELRRKQKSGQSLFILDVRSRGEWMAGHIEGAIHIPGGELPKRTAEVPRNIPVHVICGSGYRSSVAASVLKRAGFEQIVNVAGGMAAWDSQALPAASGR
jgi:hydroxyacylglutathione hydrolase